MRKKGNHPGLAVQILRMYARTSPPDGYHVGQIRDANIFT